MNNVRGHTPGPWVGMQWDGQSETSVMKGANGSSVFRVKQGLIPNISDARLIAAAPEMLEMLQDLAEWIETGMVDDVHYDETCMRDAIRDLLARIDGGNNA